MAVSPDQIPTRDTNDLIDLRFAYRLMISDGELFTTSMLATQLNHLILEGGCQKFSIIRLTNYTINMVGERRVVVLLNVELVEANYPKKIGAPVSIETNENRAGDASAKPSTGPTDTKPIIAASKPQPQRSSSTTKPSISTSSRAGGPSVIPIAGLSPYSNK